MTMGGLRFGVVLDPLLQLSARADLQWRQARAGPLETSREVRIHTEDGRALPASLEQLADQLQVHRGSEGEGLALAVDQVVVLGRGRGVRHELSSRPRARRCGHEQVECEFRRALHRRIRLVRRETRGPG